MMIGFVQRFPEPTYYFWLTYMVARENGIEMFYFGRDDIDYETKTINAWFPTGQGLLDSIRKKVDFPDIVDDIDLMGWEGLPQYKKLCSSLSLSLRVPLTNKQRLDRIIRESEFFYLAIETYTYSEQNIDTLLEKHAKLIIKPSINSSGGKGIYILSKEREEYILQYERQIERLSNEAFFARYDKMFREKSYAVQPYLNFKTNSGTPFYIRLTVARNKDGKCVPMVPMIVVGNANNGITNMMADGYVIFDNYESFLEAEFGEDSGRIIDELNLIAKSSLDLFQKHHYKTIPSAGLDIGIDRNNGNALKFIEINDCPVVLEGIQYQYVRTRVDFYKYVIANYDKMLAAQQKSLQS